MREQRSEFGDYAAARRAHLRRYAYALCGDWHAADDAVQIALAQLDVAWPRIRRAGAEDAYVRRTVARAVVSQSRRPWRRETSGLPADDVSTRAVDLDAAADLVRALQQLPMMQRRAVVLRHWLDLSVAETAAELGISEGTVKSHTSRALARLHALLRRRRGYAGAAAAVLVSIGALGVGLTASDHADDRPSADPSLGSLGAGDLVSQCRDGNQTPAATAALFGSGAPTVEGISRNDHQIELALQSADGDYWASCFVHSGAAEFHSGMTVYRSVGTAHDTGFASGTGCDETRIDSCRTFVASFVDRLPAAVAAVEFTTADGVVTRVVAHDGYVVFNHLGRLPPGQTWDTVEAVVSIHYLNADGRPIAGEGEGAEGLPGLMTYPALRGQEIG